MPLSSLRILIEYLRGQGDHTIKCALQAALAMLSWAADLLPDDHPHPMAALSVAMVADPATALEGLLPTEGVAAPEGLPSWLIPLLLEVLRRLIAA